MPAVGERCSAAKRPGAGIGHKPALSSKLYVLQDIFFVIKGYSVLWGVVVKKVSA